MASTEGTPAEGAPSEATRREELRRLVLELQKLVLDRGPTSDWGPVSGTSCDKGSCNARDGGI